MKIRNITIFVLIILNSFLMFRVMSLKKVGQAKAESTQNQGDRYFPQFTLYDLEGRRWTTGEALQGNTPTLFVFFVLNQCPGCLAELELWKEAGRTGSVNVIGVVKHIDERELRLWAESTRIPFPILFDKAGEIATALGLETFPMKVCVERNGRILFFDGVRLQFREKATFLDNLRKMGSNPR